MLTLRRGLVVYWVWACQVPGYSSYGYHAIFIPGSPGTQERIQPAMSEALRIFTEYTPPARLSRNLRNMFLEYLSLRKDGYSFDLDDLILDLLNLFEFLESLEKED